MLRNTLYLFTILYSFFDLTTSSFLFYDPCKNLNNIDRCINEYGCGWCNITNIHQNNTSFIQEYSQSCKEINICPVNNSDVNCIIKETEYHKINCFLFSIISWFLYLCAILFLCACFISCFSYCGLVNVNEKKGMIGPVFVLTIFTVSIVLLCSDAFVFSGFFLTMFVLSFIFFMFFTYKFIRYKNSKNEYRASYYYDKNNQKESLLN